MITTTNLDFETTRRIARRMTREALIFTVKDCREAMEMAETMEREGYPVSKTGGYYRDEATVYRAELRRRDAKRAKLAQG